MLPTVSVSYFCHSDDNVKSHQDYLEELREEELWQLQEDLSEEEAGGAFLDSHSNPPFCERKFSIVFRYRTNRYSWSI